MTQQAPSDKSITKATVLFVVWFALLAGIYVPGIVNLDSSQKAQVFLMVAITCLFPAVLVTMLSRRNPAGYSWMKFISIYTVVLLLVSVVVSFITGG